MGASEKLLVLLTRAEKSTLSNRAAADRVSMGEVVRRAVALYQSSPPPSSDEETALVRLTAELRASTRRASSALSKAERDIDSAIEALRETRTQIKRRSVRKVPVRKVPVCKVL